MHLPFFIEINIFMYIICLSRGDFMEKKLILRYFTPADNSDEGWEKYSLPIGNGYFGASVFGGTDSERIQFTTNTFANNYANGGVSNFSELFIDFNHSKVQNYERVLNINTGTVFSSYNIEGINVKRESFVSYPDKVFAYNIHTEKGSIDFDVRLVIPYLEARPLEDGGRTGEVRVEGNVIIMRGTLPSRELIYEARMSVVTDGEIRSESNKITIKNSSNATIYYTLDTSYKLCPEVFLDGNHKAMGDDPHEAVVECLEKAKNLGWNQLYIRHVSDYTNLMDRVTFDLGGVDDGRSTEELLTSYKCGNTELYLEELYYAYGRHLLVCSSREGTPPASLQGVWTVHDKSPWGSGIWHNINVQMNYWPSFTTNLTECFKAYAEYWKNYKTAAEINASNWIKEIIPQNFKDGVGECGWIIGTAAFMYEIEGMSKNTHSGPGTGGMTSKMFWDYYDFTRDENILKAYTYPAIHGMSKFLTKCVKNYDGRYLCSYSASPEQILSGRWVQQHKKQQYWHTVGCGFDQQFIYENAIDDLKCSKILNIFDQTTEIEKEQIDAYEPIQIGYSGQIKEYDEEHFYGEIGEAQHRHISQLVALMPGSIITNKTPAWMDAARITLELRGDKSSGWALAHRLNAWARLGEGNHAYLLLQNLLKERTYPNLWDIHPPFQIDGNFGATAGMTEMLIQSHEGCLTLFPALPDSWKNVSFKGLKARGNFTVDGEYKNNRIVFCKIKSEVGGELKLRYSGGKPLNITCDGKNVKCDYIDNIITLQTQKGATYIFEGFGEQLKCKAVTNLTSCYTVDGVVLNWTCNEKCQYKIYRAKDNDKDYNLIAITDKSSFVDREYNINNKARLTYKIVSGDNECNSATKGALTILSPATALEEERYKLKFSIVNE